MGVQHLSRPVFLEELVGEGDTVAGRLIVSGTHEGSLMSEPPTGCSVRNNRLHFVCCRDGQAVGRWGVGDDLSMMRQLGLVVVPGPRTTAGSHAG
jgi:predicted ester cyclase